MVMVRSSGQSVSSFQKRLTLDMEKRMLADRMPLNLEAIKGSSLHAILKKYEDTFEKQQRAQQRACLVTKPLVLTLRPSCEEYELSDMAVLGVVLQRLGLPLTALAPCAAAARRRGSAANYLEDDEHACHLCARHAANPAGRGADAGGSIGNKPLVAHPNHVSVDLPVRSQTRRRDMTP